MCVREYPKLGCGLEICPSVVCVLGKCLLAESIVGGLVPSSISKEGPSTADLKSQQGLVFVQKHVSSLKDWLKIHQALL